MNNWVLNEGERLDDLVRGDMKIIQRPDQFCFSLDSILAAHYVSIRKKDRIADLGTGTGVIALLLSTLGGEDITAFEINPVMADLARRNVNGNNKSDCIKVVECDYRNVKELYPTGSFDSVVVNPPYREIGTGRMNHCEGVASASYELNVTLEDIFHLGRYFSYSTVSFEIWRPSNYGSPCGSFSRFDYAWPQVQNGSQTDTPRICPNRRFGSSCLTGVQIWWTYGINLGTAVINP